jgi:diadenylate cyclase
LIEFLVNLLRLHQLRDPWALVDIVVLWAVIYQVMLLVRRTRVVQMFAGLLGIVLLWWTTSPEGFIRLRAVHWVLQQLLVYSPFALIVLFQQPIRQALTHFGRYPFRQFRTQDITERIIDEVALAASAMASKRVGALVVFERQLGLRNYVETGIQLDGIVTYDLLINIFTPRTPLHDGAVIIGENRIKGASCFLPLTTDPYISRKYGTRHRAAIGITEETDAVAVVVSEERGLISAAIGGRLEEDLDTSSLKQLLTDQLGPDRGRTPGGVRSWFARNGATEERRLSPTRGRP